MVDIGTWYTGLPFVGIVVFGKPKKKKRPTLSLEKKVNFLNKIKNWLKKVYSDRQKRIQDYKMWKDYH